LPWSNRKTLPADRIECERIAIGEDEDYKPSLTMLPVGGCRPEKADDAR